MGRIDRRRWLLVAAALACLGSGCRRVPAAISAAAPSREGPIHLVDVAAAWGLNNRLGHGGRSPLTILETAGGGGALLDYDGDGYLDVLVVGERRLMLSHNEGGHRFRDVSTATGLAGLIPGTGSGGARPPIWMGCAVGDIDNDGFPDIYVSGYRCSVLLHNRAGVAFEAITERAGVLNRDHWETSAAFFDADGDGREDLYVARYLRFGSGDPQTCLIRGVPAACPPHYYDAEMGVFYRNRGGLRFLEQTRSAGLATAHGKGLGVAVADIDADGRPDLYVANDGLPADQYRNLGGGRFGAVGLTAGTAYTAEGQSHAGMGADWADVDNDGRLDLIVTAFQHEGCTLFRNEGKGLFTEVGAEVGLRAATVRRLGFGAKFADFDNDGWVDLALANGHVQDTVHRFDETANYAQPPQLFRNDGSGGFQEVSDQVGPAFRLPRVGRALCAGDIDNDGREDLLIIDAEGAPLLLDNQSPRRNHWLGIRLRGVRSPRDGAGAVVEVQTAAGRQRREAGTSGSYLAASDPRVHFGLGSAAEARAVTVRWPSGTADRMSHVTADRWISVVEGRGRVNADER